METLVDPEEPRWPLGSHLLELLVDGIGIVPASGRITAGIGARPHASDGATDPLPEVAGEVEDDVG
jgi:hypothetical protein